MENIATQSWFNDPATQKVISTFEAAFGWDAARFVGGCVRNAILGKPINDIDIATVRSPEEVLESFQAAGFAVIPTGLQHGTVTVVVNKVPFEVTTLRRDVDTDGRHATVEFHQSWEEDAKRRDFTMNALYADFRGNVIDYVGGLNDIANGQVVFVGHPRDRIQEDYLRIMRFYRFHAIYGSRWLDSNGAAWCGLLKNGLKQISAERISAELLKLLDSPNIAMRKEVVRDMYNAGVLELVVPNFHNLSRFYPLQEFKPDAILSLTSMLPNYEPKVREAGNKLRLSAAQTTRMCKATIEDGKPLLDTSPQKVRELVYRMGLQAYLDQMQLLRARQRKPLEEEVLQVALDFKPGKPPVSGDDLLVQGWKTGKELGRALHLMEERWIESDFTMTKEDLFDWYYNEMK